LHRAAAGLRPLPAPLPVEARPGGPALMGIVERDWFDPRRLFDEGYPDEISSAMRRFDVIRQAVRDEIVAFGAHSILEVGPGDAPAADGLPGVVFLDLSSHFLARLGGARVLANLFQAPFAPGTFDLVVVSDVLTHIRPAQRRQALVCLSELGRDVLIFNPEPGTARVEGSPVHTILVTAFLQQRGYRVNDRKFVAATASGEYVMRMV